MNQKTYIRRSKSSRPAARDRRRGAATALFDHMESRVLLSAAPSTLQRHTAALQVRPALTIESASAQLNLVSTTGTVQNPIYNYDITLTNTGTVNLGSFWFGWLPGEDLLPALPSTSGNPSGWASSITGSHNSLDGSAIEWVLTTGSALAPNHSLSGFTFSSTDSPDHLTGNSPTHTSTPILTAFVYGGIPFSDAGFQFLVSPVATTNSSTSTHTVLSSTASSAPAGDPVTLTATVTPDSGGATPTGSVDFIFNGQVLQNVPLAGDGTAALTTSSLPQGADQITARYNGDATYSSSSSLAFTETISAAPHLVFAALPTTAAAGHALSLVTVNVVDSLGHIDALNGSTITLSLATFPAGATLSGTVSVSAIQGVAHFDDLSLARAGSFTLSAAGPSLSVVTSKKFTIAPDTATSHLMLLSQPSDTTVGKPFAPAISVQIVDQFNNVIATDHSAVNLSLAAAPSGAALTGNPNVNSAKGTATFKNISLKTAGPYTLQLADLSLADPTPVSFPLTINPATTSLAPPHAATSYTFGKTINLTSMLKSSASATVPFTGSVSLLDQNSAALGTATAAANGAVKFSLSNIPAGTYTCTLSYPGDASHSPITSSTFTLIINLASSTTTLKTSPAKPAANQPLTLTAIVASSGVFAPRTGTITFKDGDAVLDTLALDGNSSASLPIPTPAAGPHSYTAVYSGDPDFKSSTSAPKKLTLK